MELRKVLLLTALLIVGFMLWEAWMREQASQSNAAPEEPQSIVANRDIPFSGEASTDGRPSITAPSSSPREEIPGHRLVTVATDVLEITLDTLGGNIIGAKLLAYSQTLGSDTPIDLLYYQTDQHYIATSGLIAEGQVLDQVNPIQYRSVSNRYELAKDDDTITVSLQGSEDGLMVEKTYRFKRNDYAIEVEYQIDNRRSSAWQGFIFSELQRKYVGENKGLFYLPTFVGAAISTQEKPYQKIKFKKIQEEAIDKLSVGGWAAMMQQYFVSAWIPPQEQMNRYYSYAVFPNTYTIGLMGAGLEVSPGDTLVATQHLYIGPEISERLKEAAPNLELTIDYGFLWPISTAIFWLMKHIYDYLGNWGWAILVITVIIKLMFYHLSATSYRSMARMRQLQPKILAIRERYADDKQKLGQATMEIYRKEKVNPLGGCLPILVQIPVFIALYWVLIESVELRHAPFIWWIKDLTVRDPYFILPLIMGLTMFIQQRLSPLPPDPMQAKIMMLMPIVFTLFFMTFPAGLVLYWTANNALSVLQQWHMTRKVDKQSKAKKHKK